MVAAPLAALALAGCASQLPTHPVVSPEETWRALRARAEADITATGEVTIWADVGRATLDCAIASDEAGNFRLRAWKLDQAALDITLTGGELWVFAPEADEDVRQLRSADIARAWRLLTGGIFDQPAPPARRHDSALEYTSSDGVRILIHRPTRTPRRFELDTPDGPLTLELDKFQLIDGHPWPMRLDLRAAGRRARIRLSTIELGVPPPPGAFTPPRRAQRVEQP